MTTRRSNPVDARVHFEVDVAVASPVGSSGVRAVGQRERRPSLQREDSHGLPILHETELATVGREEWARCALGALQRSRTDLLRILYPEPGRSVTAPHVHDAAAIRRNR